MRQFEAVKAVRTKVPLLLGLYGPSGGGKTLSALRLAKGMGGKTLVLDTENKRSLHYASDFEFQHVHFQPKFSPQEYGEALQFCVEQKAANIIVDSGSHMHEGEGGMLEMHADELARLGGKDSMNFTAWIKPKRQLTRFVQDLLRMQANFIFCFRAKEKLKIVRGANPVNMGWMPIMPDELPYEMTINALLPPGANGVPQWKSDMPGETLMVKCPGWARSIVATGQPFDESMGAALARWAAGDSAPKVDPNAPRFIKQFGGELGGKMLAEGTMEEIAAYIGWLESKRESYPEGSPQYVLIHTAYEAASKFFAAEQEAQS